MNNSGDGTGFFLISMLLSLLFIAGAVILRRYMTTVNVDTRTPDQINTDAHKEIQETKQKYGIDDDNSKKGSSGIDVTKIAGDLLTNPATYESIVLSMLLKTVLFKAEQKGMLKTGEVAAKAIARALEKVGAEAAAKVTEEVGFKMGEMALGMEAGPPGWLFDVFQGLSVAIDLWDPAGFNQFGSNKDIILDVRNKVEIATITAFKKNNKSTPLVFSISNVKESPTLKPLASVFSNAMSTYQSGLMTDAIKQLPDNYYNKFLDDIDKKIDVSSDKDLIDAIVNKSIELMNKNPKDRDAYIFQYMNSNIQTKLKQYIEYNQNLSSKNIIAVSLSKKGCEVFNKETLNNENVAYIAIYSKKYRDLNSNGQVITKQVSSTVAQQSFLKAVMNMCTGTSLTSKMEIFKKMPRATVNPSDYGVTFNDDTGVCNYTKNYCERFGLKYKGSVTVGDITFPDCTELPGEELASLIFGTTLTHGAVFLGEKAIDGIEAGYDATRKKAVSTWKDTKGFFNKVGSTTVKGLKVAGGAIEGAGKDAVHWTEGAGKDALHWTEGAGKDALHWTGGAISTIGGWFSDQKLKTNIYPVEGKIYGRYQLPLYMWDWKPDNPFGLAGKHMGVMSSEVRKVCPEAVRVYHGYDVVNYNMLV